MARLVRVYRPGFMCVMLIISSRSIVLYIACILSFVWRAGTTNHERTYVLSPRAELGIRITFSVVFGLGVVYFVLVIRTFWQYGDAMDKSLKAKVAPTPPLNPPTPRTDSASTGEDTVSSIYHQPGTPTLVGPNLEPFSPQKIMDLPFQSQDNNVMPQSLQSRFSQSSWWEFIDVPYYTCPKPHDAEWISLGSCGCVA